MVDLLPLSYPCLLCGQDGLSELEMSSHMLAVHEISDISCPMCSLSGLNAEQMNLHVNTSHLDFNSPAKPIKANMPFSTSLPGPTKTKQFCPTSAARKNSPSTADVLTCPMCSYFTSDSADILNVHIHQVHFDEDAVPSSQKKQGTNVSDNVEHTFVEKDDSENNENIASSSRDQNRFADSAVGASNRDALAPLDENNCLGIRRENLSNGSVSCPICDSPLESDSTLKIHISTQHPDFSNVRHNEDGGPIRCPVCDEAVLDSSTMQSHVDTHFQQQDQHDSQSNDWQMAQVMDRRERQTMLFNQGKALQPSAESSQAKTNTGSRGRGRGNPSKRKSNASPSGSQTSMLDFYAKQNNGQPFSNSLTIDDSSTVSKGIIQRLSEFYAKPNKFIAGYWLASPSDHYSGSYVDRGWGCGYRNFQILLSCLVSNNDYRSALFNDKPDIPSLPKIQTLIEEAWRAGFDPQGGQQLNNKLCNTRKWIGATEIFAALSSLKIKCQLVDFYRATGPDDTHPCLFEWVLRYFKQDGFKAPLYFQHQGHSRTIIGIEQSSEGNLKLLIFDPGTSKSQMQQFLRKPVNSQLMKTLRRTPGGIKAKQYQILAVRGILTSQEQQEYKLVRSERVP